MIDLGRRGGGALPYSSYIDRYVLWDRVRFSRFAFLDALHLSPSSTREVESPS